METKIKDKQTGIMDPASTAETDNWNLTLNGPPEEDDIQFEEDDLDDLEDDEFPVEEDLDDLDYDEEEDIDFLESLLH